MDASPGGLNRYFGDLAQALQRAGWSVQAVVFAGPAGPLDVGSLGASLPTRVLRYLRATQRAGDVEVVDAHFALYALLPMYVGKLRNKPWVVHFQGPWAAESAVAGAGWAGVALKRMLERAVYRRATAVIVLCPAFKELLADHYGVARGRIHVVPPSVDAGRFSAPPLSAEEGSFRVVCARRLETRMGIDVLLRAWQQFLASYGDGARLRIIGTGTQERQLRDLAASLSLGSSVEFLGRVADDELIAEYGAADCAVVPTRSLEGFGLVVLEAMACGTPSIVTRVGGLPEAVAELDDSLIVEPEDVASLAHRLERAARGDLPTRAQLLQHLSRFTPEVMVVRHGAIYAAAVGETVPPQSRG